MQHAENMYEPTEDSNLLGRSIKLSSISGSFKSYDCETGEITPKSLDSAVQTLSTKVSEIDLKSLSDSDFFHCISGSLNEMTISVLERIEQLKCLKGLESSDEFLEHIATTFPQHEVGIADIQTKLEALLDTSALSVENSPGHVEGMSFDFSVYGKGTTNEPVPVDSSPVDQVNLGINFDFSEGFRKIDAVKQGLKDIISVQRETILYQEESIEIVEQSRKIVSEVGNSSDHAQNLKRDHEMLLNALREFRSEIESVTKRWNIIRENNEAALKDLTDIRIQTANLRDPFGLLATCHSILAGLKQLHWAVTIAGGCLAGGAIVTAVYYIDNGIEQSKQNT